MAYYFYITDLFLHHCLSLVEWQANRKWHREVCGVHHQHIQRLYGWTKWRFCDTLASGSKGGGMSLRRQVLHCKSHTFSGIRRYKPVADIGEGPGLPPLFILRPNWGPKGRKNIFWRPPLPPPPYLRDDRDAPTPVVWIRHCKQHQKCRHHSWLKLTSQLATWVLVI